MRDLQMPGRSPVYATNGMAATSHPLSSQAALDVLKVGGNALDAAICACSVQCVVEPGSTGIGGDNFCLYAPGGSSRMVAYNGSGRAPGGAAVERLTALGVGKIERTSPHAVTVPGAVDAWCRLNDDHGTIPLKELLQPAIDLARQGYPVSPRVHADWQSNANHLASNDTLSAIFLPGGTVPALGSLHHQPGLADALEMIGREGRAVLYEGELAEEMVACLQSHGGLHKMSDFATARGEYVEPITTEFGGSMVHECPPNGQGAIALLLLNMFAHGPTDDPLSEERIHFELEACRLAYGMRDRHLADPAQQRVDVASLINPAFAKQLVSRIDPNRATPSPDLPPLTPHRDTVTISVIDKDRNACSFINTLFWGWGSGITTPKHGIVLTNRGEGFVMEPGHPNCIAPGKRPLHTIIPGMVSQQDRVTMSFGVMGGEYQAMGHAQFLSRMADFGCDIQEAQDMPRWMVDPFDGTVEIERGVSADTIESLRQRGHKIDIATRPIGGSQAIAIDWNNGVLIGGSDPRKDGCAAGY